MIVRFHNRKHYDTCIYECEMETLPRAGDLISLDKYTGEVKEVWWYIGEEPIAVVIFQEDEIYPPSLSD